MGRLALLGLLVVLSAAAAASASGATSGLTADRLAKLSADRTQATVTGSITCTSGDSVTVSSTVIEVVGRLTHEATGSTDLSCTGGLQAWSVVVSTGIANSPPLVPGPANVFYSAFDETDQTFNFTNGTVVLVR